MGLGSVGLGGGGLECCQLLLILFSQVQTYPPQLVSIALAHLMKAHLSIVFTEREKLGLREILAERGLHLRDSCTS